MIFHVNSWRPFIVEPGVELATSFPIVVSQYQMSQFKWNCCCTIYKLGLRSFSNSCNFIFQAIHYPITWDGVSYWPNNIWSSLGAKSYHLYGMLVNIYLKGFICWQFKKMKFWTWSCCSSGNFKNSRSIFWASLTAKRLNEMEWNFLTFPI